MKFSKSLIMFLTGGRTKEENPHYQQNISMAVKMALSTYFTWMATWHFFLCVFPIRVFGVPFWHEQSTMWLLASSTNQDFRFNCVIKILFSLSPIFEIQMLTTKRTYHQHQEFNPLGIPVEQVRLMLRFMHNHDRN